MLECILYAINASDWSFVRAGRFRLIMSWILLWIHVCHARCIMRYSCRLILIINGSIVWKKTKSVTRKRSDVFGMLMTLVFMANTSNTMSTYGVWSNVPTCLPSRLLYSAIDGGLLTFEVGWSHLMSVKSCAIVHTERADLNCGARRSTSES